MGVNVGGLDHAGAALVYGFSTAFSWAKTLAIPGIQAAANIKVLEHQDKSYRSIRNEQRQIVDVSLANYLSQLDAILPQMAAAYPDVPQAAEYVPVDPCAEQDAQIECNLESVSRADEWATCINRLNNQQDIARAVMLDPRWTEHVDLYAMSVGDLLRGRWPVSAPALADTAELDAFTARNGADTFRTARSFGLSKGRAAQTGRSELRGEADMLAQVSPHNRQMDLRDMMQTPQQRMALALTQSQLIQNSLQNVLNRDAQKPPYLMAQLSARLEMAINALQQEMSKATLVDSHVPNYAAILQPQINELTRGLSASMTRTPLAGGTVARMDPYTDYEPRIRATK